MLRSSKVESMLGIGGGSCRSAVESSFLQSKLGADAYR